MTNYHKLGGSNQRNVFFHSFEVRLAGVWGCAPSGGRGHPFLASSSWQALVLLASERHRSSLASVFTSPAFVCVTGSNLPLLSPL